MKYEQCHICGQETATIMNEVDVAVGIIRSNEMPICEQCHMSDDDDIKEQIKKLNDFESDPF